MQIYEPWKGAAFRPGGLLLLSESAYGGEWGSPQPNHPTDNTIKNWVFERFDDRGVEGHYIAAITRAICREKHPTMERRKDEWAKVAYSIYVQRPMVSKNHRPTMADFKEAQEPFLRLIETIQPGRVVITSLTAWDNMPHCEIYPDPRYGAYRLANDDLVWCVAIPHPRASLPGTGWEDISAKIDEFKRRELPKQHGPSLVGSKW